MKSWFAIFCAICSLSVMAETSTFPAGEYRADGGWGTLNVKPAKQGKQSFELFSMGANGHSCELSGEISKGSAVLSNGYDDERCVVSFKATKGNAITVSSKQTMDACRGYCGARASFDDVYKKPAKGCDSQSIANARSAFLKLYKSKNYAAAERTLAPVLKNCQRNLFWLTDGSIRNDLALTQAKLGNGAACYATLKPLMEDAALSDKAVCDHGDHYLPPTDCMSYLPIVQAARTNLKLCAKAKK